MSTVGHRPGAFSHVNKKHKTGRHRSKGSINNALRGKVDKVFISYYLFVRRLTYDVHLYLPEIALLNLNEIILHFSVVSVFRCPRFKRHYQFITPNLSRLNEVLSVSASSDVMAFLWPLSGEISEELSTILNVVSHYGLPTTLHFLPGLNTLKKPKLKEHARNVVRKLMIKWSFGEKLMACDNNTDGLSVLRILSEIKKKPTILQKRHSYLICEKSETLDVTADGFCTLKLTGYARGPPLNVNHLIHIQGYGDYQLKEVKVEDDPLRMKKKMVVISEQNGLFHHLTAVFPVETNHCKKKVPVGTSSYQAAWIFDDNEAEEESRDSEEEAQSVSMEDVEDLGVDTSLVEKFRQERMDAQFPDEIDTPLETPARVRFQRYRGLKSFRTSYWNPAENLPISYARIFKFADYRCSRKNALSSIHDENEYTVSSGSYITLSLMNVPLVVAENFISNSGMVVYSLLPHEQRMTVVNMVLNKYPNCGIPIANKQKLLFYVGYRRFEAQPIFSQHTNGDKFKMERFMPSKGSFVATVFAPVIFPPSPVLAFHEDAKGKLRLVAFGGVLNLNPDRIVLKRVVLSGHPFRIYRRHAVVRYMFFNREDIEWFKPIDVYTPRGRHGNITEPLGTHGYMKCVFDQQLNAMDSVMLNLYKRVFPKWTYNPEVADKLYSKKNSA
ncbi:unnamed protein product [Enterobius vermicularis]|uniref:Pre-rRNA-processing protein TSR1 homolog n=1 Tax=Enterobius vermicularis TaxID=51028 RepID=A0A158QAP9_ENTVE|nr:unnamed protein product [Enterobius vermicularis]